MWSGGQKIHPEIVKVADELAENRDLFIDYLSSE